MKWRAPKRTRPKLFQQTSLQRPYTEVIHDCTWWVLLPRLPLSFLALFAFSQACQHVPCEQTGRRWAGARICLYGNTERGLSVSRTDGTEAPDRFRFPKTGTLIFLVRRTGVFAVVSPDPPQPEHPQALRGERQVTGGFLRQFPSNGSDARYG